MEPDDVPTARRAAGYMVSKEPFLLRTGIVRKQMVFVSARSFRRNTGDCQAIMHAGIISVTNDSAKGRAVRALQIFFKVPVEVWQEDDCYFSSCFLLDTVHTGPNKHESLMALTDAVQGFMTICCNNRAVDDVMRQHGLCEPSADDEMATGNYIDISIRLKIPEVKFD
jgi:hypothetical protein